MIITRTPYRVSFFGGGSDYPEWYKRHGGACLSATLNSFCYIGLRKMPPFLGSRYRVFWSKSEHVNKLDDIEHSGVRGCLQYMKMDEDLEINHMGDLPARSGLGSSSAFTVGMLHALYVLKGEMVGRGQLTKDAIYVEQNVLGETVGIQDQIACSYGGMNRIDIRKDGAFTVTPVSIPGDLEGQLMLFFTGLQRQASDIAQTQVDNFKRRETELKEIMALVDHAENVLRLNELDDFGRLLNESWLLKRQLSDKVSNSTIDDIYNRAIKAGALGGKVLGAGGGGFILFYTKEPEALRKALPELIEAKFRFGVDGSQLMVNSP